MKTYRKTKMFAGIALALVMVFAFASTAFAALPDPVSYSATFSNWFYTTGTTQKTESDQDYYRDLNTNFERVSDGYHGGYFNVRLYTTASLKAADYFQSDYLGYRGAGLFPAYQGSAGVGTNFKLKVENVQTGTPYAIAGSYRLLNYRVD